VALLYGGEEREVKDKKARKRKEKKKTSK